MTTKSSQEENVYDLLSSKSENVFYKETKPPVTEGSSFCVRIQPVFLSSHKGIDECDGK